MSSTSSSDWENGDYYQSDNLIDDNYNNYACGYYGRHIGSNPQVPFCTMAHPLIYYAQIQRPLFRIQRNEPPRKENQNCFVKAFKWYTQERVPDKKNNDVGPERIGFANWLDSKYVEYLRESCPNQVYELTVQETTTIDPCVPSSSPYEPCKTKRFSRMKSPWRKRRRPCKDSGDVENGPNQSCEFILKPKDLTRAASECCYPTPIPSDTPGTRCSARSQSLTSICCERSVPKHIDTIPCTAQEGSHTQQPIKPPSVCHREQIQQMPSKSRRADMSCQCPEEQLITANAETQYEPTEVAPHNEGVVPCCCSVDNGHTPKPVKIRSRKLSVPDIKPMHVPSAHTPSRTQLNSPKKQRKIPKRSSVLCQCPEESIVRVDTHNQYPTDPITSGFCNVCAPCRDFQEKNQMLGAKTLRRQSLTTVVVNDTANHASECVLKEIVTTTTSSKCTCPLPCVANDVVQTSDHSICLERPEVYPYPLFMKIVCADRLNN